MTTLITFTLNPAIDILIVAKVMAHNGRGWGQFSEVNTLTSGARIEKIPVLMSEPVFDPASSDNTNIALSWTAPTGTLTGGSSVTLSTPSYKLYWNQGAAGAYVVQQSLSSTSVVVPASGGTSYKFYIVATNKYGDSPAPSDLTTLTAIIAG
jgi:hypothetical protein